MWLPALAAASIIKVIMAGQRIVRPPYPQVTPHSPVSACCGLVAGERAARAAGGTGT